MRDWLDGMAGPGYGSAVMWTFAALILLVIVLVIVRLVRSLTAGTFVAGGRNRKTRLAVMDATAVDSHRRLVLVRRDDIEHLLLIGGPTDLVVERDIRLVQARRPTLAGPGHAQQPAPRPRTPQPGASAVPSPPPIPPQPAMAASLSESRPQAQSQSAHPHPAPHHPVPVRPAASSAPSAPSHPGQPQPPSPATPLPAVPSTIDDTLLHELEISLDEAPPAPEIAPTPKTAAPSLDEEMARLLGELSNHKK
jgi:hypothetical protein